MTKHRKKPPTAREICEAHAELLAELPNVAPGLADVSCWACGTTGDGFTPERAHVVAHADGGSNEPGNFVLLCALCHREHPDGQPWRVQRAWLLTRPSASDLLMQIVAPILAACEAEASRRGRPGAVSEWTRTAARPNVGSPSAGFANTIANVRAAYIAAFFAWLDETEPRP